jgi:hypothetical protein
MVIVGFASCHAIDAAGGSPLFIRAAVFTGIVRCKASDDLAATACSRASTRRFGDILLR